MSASATAPASSSHRGAGVRAARGPVGGGGGGGGAGTGGLVGSREMDRLLTALPRFLQDGNQETRHHAKTVVAVLLDAGEVDESRLQKEIPPPMFERLQRELLNSSLLSGPDYTSPAGGAATGSRSSSSSSYYGSRNGRNSSTRASGISRRLGASGPSSSKGTVASPGTGSSPSSASGRRIGSGYCDAAAPGGGSRRRPRPGGGGGWSRGKGGEGDCRRWGGGTRGRAARGGDGGYGSYVDDDDDDDDDDENNGVGFADRSDTGLVSSPPQWRRSPPPPSLHGSGNRADADEVVAGRGKRNRNRSSSDSGRRSGSTAKGRPDRGFREAELLLPAVHGRLDSGDWRERLKGLEEATSMLEEHGGDLYATGKYARLVDRMVELLSDGNLKVNLLALEGVVRLGHSMGNRLEPLVNTLVPAVCKNLASSNQQRTSLAEGALDALCEAIDPCLMVQPVATLAQYGNARLKVPMLDLLRDLTPDVGALKPVLLTKYVRPAALSLVRENHPNVRDSGLSLLRAVETALLPTSSFSSSSRIPKTVGKSRAEVNAYVGTSGRGDGGVGSDRVERARGQMGDGGRDRVEGLLCDTRVRELRRHRDREAYARLASTTSVMTASSDSNDGYAEYPNDNRRKGRSRRRT